ncbi:MAG TPA: antifreeze protein [Planctomycetes bacterium]|nr:antifreeze protein [Planctomycetota bacterium]
MGLGLEVIKWEDRSGGRRMVQRVPQAGMADLKLGARCIVQEGQAAVFFRNGQAMDVLKPGGHTLSTENIPLISKLYKLVYADAPFQSAVYFVSLKAFRDLKWGTKEPILLEDTKFGFVNVRAFGKFSVKITDPQTFVKEVVGTEGRQDSSDIEKWFKDVVVARFADLLAEYMTGKSVVQLQAKRDELSVATKARTADDFAKYGIELHDFIVSSISLPEEVKAAINQRASMGALGLNAQGGQGYMQMAMAQALKDSANNPGGSGGGMMNAGLGLGMGMMMPGMMQGAMNPGMGMPGAGMGHMGQQVMGGAPPMQAAAPPPLPAAASFHAAINGAQQGPFDVNAFRAMVGQGQVNGETLVWRNGMAAWTPAKQVPELAAIFAAPPPLPGGAPPPLPT